MAAAGGYGGLLSGAPGSLWSVPGSMVMWSFRLRSDTTPGGGVREASCAAHLERFTSLKRAMGQGIVKVRDFLSHTGSVSERPELFFDVFCVIRR
jgi:hypothetical protein